jgi:hypothetical protein
MLTLTVNILTALLSMVKHHCFKNCQVWRWLRHSYVRRQIHGFLVSGAVTPGKLGQVATGQEAGYTPEPVVTMW